MNAAAAITLSHGKAREQLRSEHQVRLVSAGEEGTAFARLPNGVYGFTYAPATETPVFSRQSYHSFEVHKQPDGAGFLLVHVSPGDLNKLKSSGTVQVRALPDPWQEATELIAVPMETIVSRLFKPVREDGNAIPLQVSL